MLSDIDACLNPPALDKFQENLSALLAMEGNRLAAMKNGVRPPFAPALGSYNMVVLGSPGVGRKKSAHVLADTLKDAGVLTSAAVVQTRAQYLLHLYARQLMVPLIQSTSAPNQPRLLMPGCWSHV